jgi:glutathione synthase/RimK-type ligase-like ATP-grasp enzyme
MRVCLLTDRPDHPTLAALPHLLRRHTVEVLDPHANMSFLTGLANPALFADVYLLKSRSPRSLALARLLQERGGRVVNDPAATQACQDRVQMAELARRAGLPFAHTLSFSRLSGFLAYAEHLASTSGFRFPIIVKSHRSRRDDLVTKVEDLARLRKLVVDWAQEPVVVQRFVPNDGWDHKLWVIGTEVFAARRRTSLDVGTPVETVALVAGELPPGWCELALQVGKVFDLQVYGLDVLPTGRGPVIIDVNAFPGYRGVPEAPAALAALVQATCTETVRRPRLTGLAKMEASVAAALGEVVRGLIGTREGIEAGEQAVLRPTYLARKPREGLVASYRTRTAGPGGLVTVLLSEQVLAGRRLSELFGSVDLTEFQGTWPGIVRCPRIGMTVQMFPSDAALPGLPVAVAPNELLTEALAEACRSVTGVSEMRVVSVDAIPVRYKPGKRCVLRYQVTAASGPGPDDRYHMVFFGKLYRDSARAAATYRLAEALWHDSPSTRALSPRPLALIKELNMVLSEGAGGALHTERVAGPKMLRLAEPVPAGTGPPAVPLAATATTLAGLHTCQVATGLARSSSGARFAESATRWSASMLGQSPVPIGEFTQTLRRLTAALSSTTAERLTLVHGALKASQLIFCCPAHAVVTDLDEARLGDPAVDVGYFLAYLRPAGFWSGQPHASDWFTAARTVFLDAYRRAMRARGADPAHLEGILRRANLFEGAVILKIVSRGPRHLTDLQPATLKAAGAEIDRCLDRFVGTRGNRP